MQIPEHSHDPFTDHDQIVCRCLKVRLSTIAEAIEVCGLSSVREIKCATGAGDGCTCCHARIR
ncbi:MAG: (2Fe-2S)-binding protein [Planctomycetota bacterium]|nr:(2Fe-2S)-binding protein [Planctomycetota bacterium]